MTTNINKSFPVFIIGVPRSGTTLLAQLLNASEQISFGKESHFFQFINKRKFKYKSDKEIINAFLNRDANAYLKYFDWSNNELASIKNKTFQIKSLKEFSDFLITYLIVNRKTERWGEKTPGHFEYIDNISRYYPNAKFINIIRDPRDVYASHQKIFWGSKSPLKFAKRYKKNVEIINANKNNPNFLLVKYEELISNPTRILNEICFFANLNFSEDMIDKFSNSENLTYNNGLEPWKNGKKNLTIENKTVKNNTKNSQMESFVSFLLKKEIKQFNYTSKNNNKVLLNFYLYIKYYLLSKFVFIYKLFKKII